MTGRDTTKISISREAFLNVGAKFVQAVLGFGGVIVLTRMLGKDGLGRYRTVLAAAFFILSISESIASVIRKRIAEVETDPPEYLITGLLIHGGVTVLTALGLFAARSVAIPYFGSVELTAGVAIIVASLGLFSVMNFYQAGIGYPARETWSDSLRSVFTLGAQVSLLVLGFEEFGAIVGHVAASIITGVFIWVTVRPSLEIPTRNTFKRVYTYARYSVPSSFVSRFYQSADPLLIRLFSGAGGVGAFTLASQLAMPGAMFASSISSVLSVKSSGIDSAGGDVRRDIVNSAAYSGLIAIPILFGSLTFSGHIMQADLFGPTFNNTSGTVLIAMALIQVASAYQKPFGSALGGVDRPDIVFRANVLVTLVYLPASIGLGHVYGLLGVLAGTVLAEGVRLAAYQFVSARLFGGVVLPKPVGHQFAAGLVMFSIVEGVSRVTNPAQASTLVILIGTGAIVYFAALSLISQHFRQTLIRTLDDL